MKILATRQHQPDDLSLILESMYRCNYKIVYTNIFQYAHTCHGIFTHTLTQRHTTIIIKLTNIWAILQNKDRRSLHISCNVDHSLEPQWSFICSEHTYAAHILHNTLRMLILVDYRNCSPKCDFSLFVLSLQEPFVPRNTHREIPMIIVIFT